MVGIGGFELLDAAPDSEVVRGTAELTLTVRLFSDASTVALCDVEGDVGRVERGRRIGWDQHPAGPVLDHAQCGNYRSPSSPAQMS